MQHAGSRREFVAAAAVAALAGCTSGQPDDGIAERAVADADRYDCDDISRPEPDEPDSEHALEPFSYPDFEFDPDSAASFTAAAEAFVVEFEHAYRGNAFLERYGERAHEVEFYEDDDRTETIETGAEEDAALVSLGYDMATSTGDDVADSWGLRVVYYVDERLALRAGHDGGTDDSPFEPDPRDDDTLVACFAYPCESVSRAGLRPTLEPANYRPIWPPSVT